jgi:hypothetical protein
MARDATVASGPTVDQVLVPYWARVERHYRDADGEPTTEVEVIRRSRRFSTSTATEQ